MLAREVLGDEEGERAVGRLRRLADLQALDVPIIVLIGGSTGTGKSTVAAEVAHRLGITRVASTDFIRQTMRAFFSREFMPTIHYSSFEAGAARRRRRDGRPDDRRLRRPVPARLRRRRGRDRARADGGLVDGARRRPPRAGAAAAPLEGALLVHVVLEIADEDVHRTHFHVRDAATGGMRAMEKYLERLDAIRRVQTYVAGRARREGVPVVENANVEHTIDQVIELVMQAAERVAPQ